MNKQEMAEWLAEKVLDMQKHSAWEKQIWLTSGLGKQGQSLENFIFSPAGFFAVWDKVEEKRLDILFDCHNNAKGRQTHVEITSCMERGKHVGVKTETDRFEAFYNAVKQALEKTR